VRSRGLRATLRRLFEAFVFSRERLIRFCKSMNEEITPVAAKLPGRMRRATLDDLDALGVFSPYQTVDEFRRWIERGDDVWVFEHEGRLIAYRVITRELPRLGAAHDLLELEPTDVWVVNMHTLPEYQGLRVQAALITHALLENRRAGNRRELSMGRLDNESSRRTIGIAGGREMQEISCTRVLGLARYRVVPAGGRRYYSGTERPALISGRPGPTPTRGDGGA
jgi:GNAT superfamily N-acetyltransferase